jgi:hypothetical protein
MRAALLCNGPSREDFLPHADEYDYILGCNSPWYNNTNATVIIDEKMVKYWFDNQESISCRAYFSKKAWIHANEPQYKDFFPSKMIEIVDTLPENDSSGHVGCKILIRQKFTTIDIWGCDSWFEDTIASYTHTLDYSVRNLNPDDNPHHLKVWRNQWNEIIKRYPNVKINFKKNH